MNPVYVMESIVNLSMEDLQSINDIGPVVAESIFEWWRDNNNLDFIKKLDKVGVAVKDVNVASQKLKGKTFVLTGTLSFMSRDEIKDIIRGLGGNLSSVVSSKTDYVVAGESPGSKYNKARDLSVIILNEEEFKKMIL